MWKEKRRYNLQEKRKNFLLYSICFWSVFILLWVYFYLLSYVPFGENSLVWSDADIQYLDFFSYFKDVLTGRNNVGYTFSKELGGTNIGTFSYYLASPFNFLVVFFPKTELHIFFTLLVSLKLSTAAVTCAFFLRHRFELLQDTYLVLLAVGYGLMQYNISQCSNIMWIDGVYMLPLILLGVHTLVKKSTFRFLSIAVGFAILFNWYSAGIDCMFAILWFFFELLLEEENVSHADGRLKTFFSKTVHFGCAMLEGIALSAVLFLPTIVSMRDSSEGSFNWELIKNEFSGDFISAVQNYALGTTSSRGSVSLFCGSFAILGCICFFFSRNATIKKKVTAGAMLMTTILLFYWDPLIVAFSLFKSVESYWYRYSYVAIFLLLFLAACFYEKLNHLKLEMPHLVLKSAVGFSLLLFVLNYLNPMWEKKYVYATGLFLIIMAILIEYPNLTNVTKKTTVARAMSVLLSVAVCLELFINISLLTPHYRTDDVMAYKQYATEAAEQVSAIRAYDDGNYRISQTTTRNMQSYGVTAYYNEAMAYNYMSITEYSSAPDGRQMDFMSRLGYRCEGVNMQIVNTPVIGTNALLGVKYVLSPYSVKGMDPVEELGMYNGKTVYENPYSLPMAFVYKSVEKTDEGEYTNPFEYQNVLFSELSGQEADIYQRLEFERSEEDNTIVYTLKIPEGNYVLYGNLPWNSTMNANIHINDEVNYAYSQWLSPSVFYIPFEEGEQEISLTLTAETIDLNDEQFYALDLDELERIVGILAQGEVDNPTIENGYVSCSVDAEAGETLFLSVPYHSGWTILLNGERIEPELFGDCLITIPLMEGNNQIEMKYHVPMVKEGLIVSLIGLTVLVAPVVYRKRKQVLKN